MRPNSKRWRKAMRRKSNSEVELIRRLIEHTKCTPRAFAGLFNEQPYAMAWCELCQKNYLLSEANGKCPDCLAVGIPNLFL